MFIKDTINKHKSQQSQKIFINDKQECLTDSKEICNAFNNFFINIGPELCKNIPTTEQNPTSYIQNRGVSRIFERGGPISLGSLKKRSSDFKRGGGGPMV